MAPTHMRVLAPCRPICGALEEWPRPKESFEAVAYGSKLNLAASHGLVRLDSLDREAPTPADREVLQPHRAGVAFSAGGPNFAEGCFDNLRTSILS
jgi:hypothetical protein